MCDEGTICEISSFSVQYAPPSIARRRRSEGAEALLRCVLASSEAALGTSALRTVRAATDSSRHGGCARPLLNPL